jgi:hypothetical protein
MSDVMTTMLRSFRVAGLIVVVTVLSGACSTQGNVPDGVTVESIRAVRLGMSRQEVERILGLALQIEDRNPPFYGNGRQTFVYFRGLTLLWRYPKLWVHLRDGHVEEVYAKQNDEAVYVLNADGSFEGKLFSETFRSSKR